MTRQEIINYLKDDLARRIMIVHYKGVEFYNAPDPIGSGVLRESIIQDMIREGLLNRQGDCCTLA